MAVIRMLPQARRAGRTCITKAGYLGGCALAVLGLPAAVQAQGAEGMMLGQVVVTASGFEQLVADAPASITVITADELEEGAFRDLTDALREVQGVATTGTANEQDIQIRGLPGQYTLILVDGRRQSTRESRPNGSAGYEQSFIPPISAIERIEIVRGPMSSLYGSDAMGGVINIITKKVDDVWRGSVTAETTVQEHSEFGNSQQLSFHLSGPLIENRLGLQVWGKGLHRSEDTQVGGLQGKRDRSIGARLTFTPTTDQEIQLELGRSQVRSLSSVGGVLASGDDSFSNHDRRYWALTHTGHWALGTSDLSLQQETGKRTSFSHDDTLGRFTAGDRVPTIRNTVLDGKFTLPFEFAGQHTVVTGFQYQHSKLTDRGHLPEDQDMTTWQWAIFAEDEWRLSDSFALTAGLRLDRNEVYGTNLSPRLYGVWHATDTLTVKGGVSTGFTTPGIRQITPGYYMPTQQGAGYLAGNPDLGPEKSTNFELGAVYDNYNGLSLGATVYQTNFRGKIQNANTHMLVDASTGDIIDPLGGAACNAAALAGYPDYRCLWRSFNVDDAVIRGVELSGSWDVNEALTLRATYTYTDSEQKTGDYAGFPLQRTPRTRASLRADWEAPLEGLKLWTIATYHGPETNAGPRIGSNGTPVEINGQAGRRYASYTLVDVGANYRVNETVAVNAAVYNLFDRKVTQEDSNNLLEGRRLWLGVTSTF